MNEPRHSVWYNRRREGAELREGARDTGENILLREVRPEDLSHADIVAGFNEWLKRFIDDPAGYQQQWQTVKTHLAEMMDHCEPSYGADCLAYLKDCIRPKV